MHAKNSPIILLSTGRAGSTLLQKILNTHHEMVIWGEHAGILNQLMNASKAVNSSEWISDRIPNGEWLLQRNRPIDADRWTAWDGSFSKKGFHENMKDFIDNLFVKDVPDNVRWGFKEIRYNSLDFMGFMSNMYPHAQFILLLRNPIDSCISFTTALAPKGSNAPEDFSSTMCGMIDSQIKPTFQFIQEAVEHYPEQSRVVLFEQLVETPDRVLGDIVKFLGLSAGFKDESVSQILKKDIVSERQRTNKEQQIMLKDMALPLLEKQLQWYDSIRQEKIGFQSKEKQ